MPGAIFQRLILTMVCVKVIEQGTHFWAHEGEDSDQEELAQVSQGAMIPDRTGFLPGQSK